MPLYGSGPVNGIVSQDRVVFQVDSEFMSIIFTGRRRSNRITGTYVVRPVAGPLQDGEFRLERTSSVGLPGGLNTFQPNECPDDAAFHSK